MEFVQSIITGVIVGLFSAGAVWGVLKTHMEYLRRDVDKAHERIDDHLTDYHLTKAH